MYQTKSYEEIRDALLTDYQNQIPGADTLEGSDIYIKASALASALWGLYQYQKYIERQVFPDAADSDSLEHHASIRGLSRKQATKASGTATLTGTNGTVVSAGLSLKTSDGIEFENTTGGTITGGVLDVTAQAKSGGISGNIANNTVLTVQDPPAGCNSAATAKTVFTGGTDEESDADLLIRLLDIIRQPPAGGNSNDYKQWALAVTGVSAAYVYPIRRGNGTVDVVILKPGDGAARIPDQTLVNSAKAYIDTVRPVTVKDSKVLAPTAKSQAVTATIKAASGYTFAQVKPWVETALTAYLNIMAPLEELYKSKVERVISDVEGVDDRSVTVPSGNVTCTDSGDTVEMITPGTLTITEMA